MKYYIDLFLGACASLWVQRVVIVQGGHDVPAPSDIPVLSVPEPSNLAMLGEKIFNIPADSSGVLFKDMAMSPGGVVLIVILSGLLLYYVVIPATKAGVTALSTPEPDPVIAISTMDKLVESLTANVNDIFHNLFI